MNESTSEKNTPLLFYKCDPFHFIPVTKTPWAGKQISQLKKKYFPDFLESIPSRIGESWEISCDPIFPSDVLLAADNKIKLPQLLEQAPEFFLGRNQSKAYGAHISLLLKLLEADDVLSVQLHPHHNHPGLSEQECGKPEAWLVLHTEPGAFVYLGFQENLTKEEITHCLLSGNPEKCLHKYEPKALDYISVPPGCVHAVGPGVLLAEPQDSMPGKSGKTWRVSDWGRLYNINGELCSAGKPRETHVTQALPSIDWTLPRGKDLTQHLVTPLVHGNKFLGTKNNPFACQIFDKPGSQTFSPLVDGVFSLWTVVRGKAVLRSGNNVLEASGGESGFIAAGAPKIELILKEEIEKPLVAFFTPTHY